MRDDLPGAEAAARRARNLLSKETWSRLALAATLRISGDLASANSGVAEALEIEPGINMSTFAPLVQHIPTEMRDRVLAPLQQAGAPPDQVSLLIPREWQVLIASLIVAQFIGHGGFWPILLQNSVEVGCKA